MHPMIWMLSLRLLILSVNLFWKRYIQFIPKRQHIQLMSNCIWETRAI